SARAFFGTKSVEYQSPPPSSPGRVSSRRNGSWTSASFASPSSTSVKVAFTATVSIGSGARHATTPSGSEQNEASSTEEMNRQGAKGAKIFFCFFVSWRSWRLGGSQSNAGAALVEAQHAPDDLVQTLGPGDDALGVGLDLADRADHDGGGRARQGDLFPPQRDPLRLDHELLGGLDARRRAGAQ